MKRAEVVVVRLWNKRPYFWVVFLSFLCSSGTDSFSQSLIFLWGGLFSWAVWWVIYLRAKYKKFFINVLTGEVTHLLTTSFFFFSPVCQKDTEMKYDLLKSIVYWIRIDAKFLTRLSVNTESLRSVNGYNVLPLFSFSLNSNCCEDLPKLL